MSITKNRITFNKNVIKPLAYSVLIPLGLTAAAADSGIHKKILGSGKRPLDLAIPNNTTLVISNYEMKDIIEIAKSLEDSGLLLKGVSETIQNEAKEQKGGLHSMLFGTLGASLLGNILARKGINRTGEEAIAKRQGRGIVRAGYGNKKLKKQQQKRKRVFNAASSFN